MIYKNKKILEWFVKRGKVKARIIYFLFLCVLYLLVFTSLAFILSAATDTSFFKEWNKNLPFSFFFFICAPFISWRFYDVALIQLKEYQRLEKKGLTKTDLLRIAFVKSWAIQRRAGLARYCFYYGGLIAGMFLLFPLSFFMFFALKITDRLFTSVGDIGLFIGKNILLSYIIGLLIFRFKWSYNQWRFKRLTNPLN